MSLTKIFWKINIIFFPTPKVKKIPCEKVEDKQIL